VDRNDLGSHLGEQRLRSRRIGQVESNRHHRHAVLRLQLGRERVQPVLPPRDKDQTIAVGGKQSGELDTDAGRCAGDDGPASLGH